MEAPPESASGLLSDNGILRGLQTKQVSIVPFRTSNLQSASYDVTLGPYFFRENTKEGFLNIYRADASQHAWLGPRTASRVKSLSWEPQPEDHISETDLVIFLKPGETILGHTCEFIGSHSPLVPALMPCSGLERSFIHVQGGMGAPGYYNRWTLRITNTSKHRIPLVVGRKIAQVVFFQTEGAVQSYTGHYQPENVSVADLVRTWKPDAMLSQVHQDAVGEGKLSLRSDPVPSPSFEPPWRTPAPSISTHPTPPSMINPDAGRAAVQQQQQYRRQGPIQLPPVARDANGDIVPPPTVPPELIPVKTREMRGPPVTRMEYDPRVL